MSRAQRRDKEGLHLHVNNPLIVAVPDEGVGMSFLSFTIRSWETGPSQLLDRYKRLVDVRIPGDEVCPEVKGESFGMEDMRGDLCEVW